MRALSWLPVGGASVSAGFSAASDLSALVPLVVGNAPQPAAVLQHVAVAHIRSSASPPLGTSTTAADECVGVPALLAMDG